MDTSEQETTMLALNPGLDRASLAERYAVKRRLQIRNILAPESAERIHAIVSALPWGLVFQRGKAVVELSPDAIARLRPADAHSLLAEIHTQARGEYQFLYAFHPLLRHYFAPNQPRHALFDVFEFLNSPATLGFVRAITGLPEIRWADAQVTCFRAGHFLKYHTDETPSQRRAAAYVLNLTPRWGRDWGGYLQFFDDKFDIEEGLRPVFNALNIFSIPMDHSVSVVSPYVTEARLSITGWFREDDPPQPIAGN